GPPARGERARSAATRPGAPPGRLPRGAPYAQSPPARPPPGAAHPRAGAQSYPLGAPTLGHHDHPPCVAKGIPVMHAPHTAEDPPSGKGLTALDIKMQRPIAAPAGH